MVLHFHDIMDMMGASYDSKAHWFIFLGFFFSCTYSFTIFNRERLQESEGLIKQIMANMSFNAQEGKIIRFN